MVLVLILLLLLLLLKIIRTYSFIVCRTGTYLRTCTEYSVGGRRVEMTCRYTDSRLLTFVAAPFHAQFHSSTTTPPLSPLTPLHFYPTRKAALIPLPLVLFYYSISVLYYLSLIASPRDRHVRNINQQFYIFYPSPPPLPFASSPPSP